MFNINEINSNGILNQYINQIHNSNINTLESIYQDNSNEICVLANSLWLENGLQYNQEAMDAIAYHYYASVYQGDLGSKKTNQDIAAWINNNTGKFLKDSTKSIELSPETIMAVYSTLYFQAKWSDEFSASKNTEGVFLLAGWRYTS